MGRHTALPVGIGLVTTWITKTFSFSENSALVNFNSGIFVNPKNMALPMNYRVVGQTSNNLTPGKTVSTNSQVSPFVLNDNSSPSFRLVKVINSIDNVGAESFIV